jgi:hypothetical protein
LIDIAPAPVFAGLEGLDDGMLRAVEVLRGMLVRRAIAAANVTADETKAEVYPLPPDLQTFFASIG